ncbi:MAG: hypothetical protein IT270_16310 [Saprospiraceae bacterium]|nr:hypothetical protein [Saprospiraceae bacterium]
MKKLFLSFALISTCIFADASNNLPLLVNYPEAQNDYNQKSIQKDGPDDCILCSTCFNLPVCASGPTCEEAANRLIALMERMGCPLVGG